MWTCFNALVNGSCAEVKLAFTLFLASQIFRHFCFRCSHTSCMRMAFFFMAFCFLMRSFWQLFTPIWNYYYFLSYVGLKKKIFYFLYFCWLISKLIWSILLWHIYGVLRLEWIYAWLIDGERLSVCAEYAYTLQVDEKSDIYSFGVVLMEVLSGKRSVESEFGDGNSIVDWVRSKIKNKDGIKDILDKSAGASCSPVREEMMQMLRIALLCTSRNPADRPSMRDVVLMLQEAKPKRKLPESHVIISIGSGGGGGDNGVCGVGGGGGDIDLPQKPAPEC